MFFGVSLMNVPRKRGVLSCRARQHVKMGRGRMCEEVNLKWKRSTRMSWATRREVGEHPSIRGDVNTGQAI